jgi:ribosomal protein S18
MFKQSFQSLLTVAATSCLLVACKQAPSITTQESPQPTETKTVESSPTETIRHCDKFHKIVSELRTAGNKAKQLDYSNIDALQKSFASSGIEGKISDGGVTINFVNTQKDLDKAVSGEITSTIVVGYVTLNNGAELTLIKEPDSTIKISGSYKPKNSKDPIIAIDSEKTDKIAIFTQNQLPKGQEPTTNNQDFCN